MPQALPNTSASHPLYQALSLGGLILGRSVPPPTQATLGKAKHTANSHSSTWHFPPGEYTPEQVVKQVSPLLESTLIQLGRDPPGAQSSRKILIDGLRSCLSLDTRESTLPLNRGIESIGNSARKDLASQAQRIGSLLVRYAQEVSPADAVNPRLSIRSSCDGHLWRHDVAGLLIGPRSNGNLMQLYNEWLHQLVLLRDYLLPFENFEEVLLNLKADAAPGTRPLETIRSQFLMQVMTAQVKRTTLLDVAKVLMAPSLPSGGYGFQSVSGLVMPTSLLTGTSSILLRYIPAILDDSRQELLFDYESKDYYSVPREKIDTPAETVPSTSSASAVMDSSLLSELTSSNLAVEKPADAKPSSSVRYIKLCGTFRDQSQFAVDLGQIARGLRYAYRVPHSDNKDESYSSEQSSLGVHKASDVLSLPNLVTSTSPDTFSLHIIPAGNLLLRMALLGKLYPENIVLVAGEGQSLSSALGVGKGFGPKFVIVGGEVTES